MPDAVDDLIEQIDAQRQFVTHREHVEQRSAHGEIARYTHLCHRTISRARQPLGNARHRELFANGKLEAAAGDVIHGRQLLQQRFGRHQQQAALHDRQARQRGDPLGYQVGQG